MLTMQLPNHFDSIFNKGWISPGYKNFVRQWNPWGDSDLAMIQVMRYNVARACAMYDEEMRRLYWSHLTFEDQLYAEAQFDYYKDENDRLFAAEIELIRTRHLERDLDLLPQVHWPTTHKLASQLRQHTTPTNITPMDWMNGMLRLDAGMMLSPPGTPFMHRWEKSLIDPGSVEIKAIIPSINNPAFFRTWREKQALNQMNVNISASLWGYDLVAAQPFNSIKGVSAKTHTLYTNESIPLPNYATFLAWFTVCGLGIENVNPTDYPILTRLCGFQPHVLLTYIVPMIPRTKEHGLRNAIATDDSHADHSLPARSSGHARDEQGRIKYGLWAIRTALIGHDGENVRSFGVAHHWLDSADTSAIGFHTRAKQMIPWTAFPLVSPYNALWSPRMQELTTSFLMDPYQANRDPMPTPIFKGRNADLGMRAVAKQLAVHFRFDEWDGSAINWCKAFEMCALWAATATQDDINAAYYKAILGLTTIPSPINGPRKFNLDSLDGAL